MFGNEDVDTRVFSVGEDEKIIDNNTELNIHVNRQSNLVTIKLKE